MGVILRMVVELPLAAMGVGQSGAHGRPTNVQQHVPVGKKYLVRRKKSSFVVFLVRILPLEIVFTT